LDRPTRLIDLWRDRDLTGFERFARLLLLRRLRDVVGLALDALIDSIRVLVSRSEYVLVVVVRFAIGRTPQKVSHIVAD
jgi:hypothetical protein